MQCLMVTFYTNKSTHTHAHTDMQITDRRWIQHTQSLSLSHSHTHTHKLTYLSQVQCYVSLSSSNCINILEAETEVATQHPPLCHWTEHCAWCIPFLFYLKIFLLLFDIASVFFQVDFPWTEHCACCIPFPFFLKNFLLLFDIALVFFQVDFPWTKHCACCIPFLFYLKIFLLLFDIASVFFQVDFPWTKHCACCIPFPFSPKNFLLLFTSL
jgi:hypothetical protein